MSERGDPHRPDPDALEPWALELEAAERDDPRSREELARVVALLRSLPDPEIPSELGDAILTRVAEGGRPRLLRGPWRPMERGIPLALAAGAAWLMIVAGLPQQLAPSLRGGTQAGVSDSLLIRVPARVLAPETSGIAVGSLPTPGGDRDRHLVSLGRPGAARLEHPAVGAWIWQRSLDHQLNQLQLDPHGFAQKLEQAAGRDEFIAQLARRAGERGDATEIAMRVRSSRHPVAMQITQRMLRAALVDHVSRSGR